MSAFGLPGRTEGPHNKLALLVRNNAWLHVAISHKMEPDCEKCEPNVHAHVTSVEQGIYNYLTSGWARPLDDWSGIVFWDPERQMFVPWSADLYLAIQLVIRLKTEGPYTGGGARLQPAGANIYTG